MDPTTCDFAAIHESGRVCVLSGSCFDAGFAAPDAYAAAGGDAATACGDGSAATAVVSHDASPPPAP